MNMGGIGEEAGEDGEALEQLKFIFNLCDSDEDGVISVEEFRKIGLDHFDKTQPMEVLIQQIDPEGSGCITFAMFRAGVETYLANSVRSRSASRGSSCVDGVNSSTELNLLSDDSTFSGDSIYPLFPSSDSVMVTNSYVTDSPPGCDQLSHCLSGDGEADSGTPLQSSPLPLRRQSMPVTSTTRGSPSLGSRVRLTRHSQLAIPVSPASLSKCSTPAEVEAEEVVSQLSDQLLDLSSKLENLEEDQKSSHEVRERLRKEKEVMQERMKEYEEHIRITEQSSQRLLQENAEQHALSINRLRRESQAQLDDITSQLLLCREEVSRLKLNESNLKTQLTAAQEQLEVFEGRVGGLEERGREREKEAKRTREQLRTEQVERHRDKETHKQELHDCEAQIKHWQTMCEEIRREKKRRSITVSDMDSEVTRLTKEVDRLKKDNDLLQARFLQHGKDLISQKVQSLADEMEDASKDDVMKVLRDTELHNARLHEYIEGLLVSIIEKHPELLEKR